jgi:hypothetical protein
MCVCVFVCLSVVYKCYLYLSYARNTKRTHTHIKAVYEYHVKHENAASQPDVTGSSWQLVRVLTCPVNLTMHAHNPRPPPPTRAHARASLPFHCRVFFFGGTFISHFPSCFPPLHSCTPPPFCLPTLPSCVPFPSYLPQ